MCNISLPVNEVTRLTSATKTSLLVASTQSNGKLDAYLFGETTNLRLANCPSYANLSCFDTVARNRIVNFLPECPPISGVYCPVLSRRICRHFKPIAIFTPALWRAIRITTRMRSWLRCLSPQSPLSQMTLKFPAPARVSPDCCAPLPAIPTSRALHAPLPLHPGRHTVAVKFSIRLEPLT